MNSSYTSHKFTLNWGIILTMFSIHFFAEFVYLNSCFNFGDKYV